jgi:NAD(P)-dependent dehydrogenase (short-subunit alcohol dehydrogenase family)
MSDSLEGRVAIVTGAGRGIGRATALALAGCGARLVVNDLGTRLDGTSDAGNPAAEVVESIRGRGGEAIESRDSVSEWSSAQRIIESAIDSYGRLDLLVNNAGLSAGGPLWELDPELFESVVRSHLFGTFYCMRAATPHMKAHSFGRIVNLLSRAGLVGMPGTAAYAAGKGGVFGLTNAASHDLAKFGITVNGVNPAATETRMVTTAIDAFGGGGEAEKRRAQALRSALQDPARVAALIAALCHDGLDGDAPRFNGRLFFVDKDSLGLFPALDVAQSRELTSEADVATVRNALASFEIESADLVYGG